MSAAFIGEWRDVEGSLECAVVVPMQAFYARVEPEWGAQADGAPAYLAIMETASGETVFSLGEFNEKEAATAQLARAVKAYIGVVD